MNEEIPYNLPGLTEYIREGARKNAALLRKMQGKSEPSATAEAKPDCAPRSGSDAPDVVALGKWMDEVTQLLCYQPDVPMTHKTDLCNALNEYNQVIHAQKLAHQNGEFRRTDPPLKP